MSTTTTGPSAAVWVAVCALSDLEPDRGAAALLGWHQVALFLLSDPAGGPPTELYAVSHHDPYGRANVMARGLVGSVGDVPVVASPLHKQRFDLRTGTCLDGDLDLARYPVRVRDGVVEVELPD